MTGRFRPRALEVEAVQWTCDNEDELAAFTDRAFMVLDDEDRENCEDPDWTASVRTTEHGTWEGLYPLGWVIKDPASGEISVADEETFTSRFEPVKG